MQSISFKLKSYRPSSRLYGPLKKKKKCNSKLNARHFEAPFDALQVGLALAFLFWDDSSVLKIVVVRIAHLHCEGRITPSQIHCGFRKAWHTHVPGPGYALCTWLRDWKLMAKKSTPCGSVESITLFFAVRFADVAYIFGVNLNAFRIGFSSH